MIDRVTGKIRNLESYNLYDIIEPMQKTDIEFFFDQLRIFDVRIQHHSSLRDW